MKLIKCTQNPVLSPNPDNYWENLVVCNPGVWYENGTFYMLYRAAGDDEQHFIRVGLATSTDGINFKRESDEPVLVPAATDPIWAVLRIPESSNSEMNIMSLTHTDLTPQDVTGHSPTM